MQNKTRDHAAAGASVRTVGEAFAGRAAWLRSTNAQMVLVTLLVGVASVLWAERLMINNGFGWDGLRYAAWAKDFYGSIFVQRVSEYYVQRVLPSAIVHYTMALFRVPFTNENVILSFGIYNLVLLLVAAWTWGRIADQLRFSDGSKWFGFVCLFASFGILKSNFYLPMSTDTSGFTLGLLMLYFFLSNNSVGFLATFVAGAFTWPMLIYQGLLLFVFPYGREPAPPSRMRGFLERIPVDTLVAAGVTATVLLGLGYVRFYAFDKAVGGYGVDANLYFISALCAALYLFFAIKRLCADRALFDIPAVLRGVAWRRVPLALFIAGGVKILAAWLAGNTAEGASMLSVLRYTGVVAVMKPLIFLVAHVVYFGPVVVLLAFFWRSVCDAARKYGVGFQLFLIMSVILSINSQSRFLWTAFPMFVVLLVQVLDRVRWSWQQSSLWVIVSLLFSKVWYTMNTAPQIWDGTRSSLLSFPLQHLFMNYGPWMSDLMYDVQGSLVLLLAVLAYPIWGRAPRMGGTVGTSHHTGGRKAAE